MGDTNMCTDNPILLHKTLNSPTIVCIQKNAEKKIVTEEDIIQANKLAFNDDIGTITNYVTSMFDVQAGFDKDSEEYKELDYRIMCGQNYQQNSIDRAKGIIAKPMPEYWHSIRDNLPKDDDTPEEIKKKAFNLKITAATKPYFMIYVYPALKRKLSQYLNNNELKVIKKFRKYNIESIEELYNFPDKTQEMIEFLSYYEAGKKIGLNPCVVNRICWIFEREFPTTAFSKKNLNQFDYRILKCETEYGKDEYKQIEKLFKEYKDEYDAFMQSARNHSLDDETERYTKLDFINKFKMKSRIICPNEQELCDIVLDLCYQTERSKQFAWDVAGEVIIHNLLGKNGKIISYPEHTGNEFEYCGEKFSMMSLQINEGGDIDGYIE